MDTAFTKKKALGQNFLTSDNIPMRIAAVCGADENTGVIEIGPGMGILTKQLVKIAPKVVAIELDDELIPHLNKRFEDADNFKLINNDILKCNIEQIIKDEFCGIDCCVCANLPYYITTPIIMKLLEGGYRFKAITVMVQKEVADRLASKPKEDGYGAITASIGYYASVKRLFTVTAGNFSPKPKVDSAVVKLDLYPRPPFRVENELLFFDVIKAAFLQRRKTLSNALASYFSDLTKEDVGDLLKTLGLRTDIRGEMLTPEQFALVANEIEKRKEK